MYHALTLVQDYSLQCRIMEFDLFGTLKSECQLQFPVRSRHWCQALTYLGSRKSEVLGFPNFDHLLELDG
jgi:hypothetical protein